MDSVRIV